MDVVDYININYPPEDKNLRWLNEELLKYIKTEEFEYDIVKLMSRDKTINKQLASECAVEQEADRLVEVPDDVHDLWQAEKMLGLRRIY